MAELFPNVRENGRKIIAAGALAAVALASSACSTADEKSYRFDVGVVCPNPSDEVDIKDIENKHGSAFETKTIEIVCGNAEAPQAMELISGDGGPVINDGTDYSSVVSIKAVGPDSSSAMVSAHIDQEANNGRIDINDIWNVTSAQTAHQAEAVPTQK